MAEEILCPNCNKPNPEALEICQYCGTIMKKPFITTEPLDALHPGDMPTKRATSDLERTLPGWLRNIRKGDEPGDQPAKKPDALQSQPVVPATPAQPPKQEPPKKKEASPLDFLAGLSQDNDEEDEVPDWMAGLKSSLPETPAPAAPEQAPIDWLADLQGETPQAAKPEAEMDWGFNVGPSLDFKDTDEPAPQITDDTPDWLTALKAQDEATKAPAFTPSTPSDQTGSAFPEDAAFGGDMPDWLSSMGQESALAAETPAAESATAENQPFGGDLPDWLSGLSDESAPQKPPLETAPLATTVPPAFEFAEEPEPVVLPPAEPLPLAEEFPSMGDLPDWLSGLDQEPTRPVESAAAFKPSVEETPSRGDTPAADLTDWLSGLDEEPIAPAESAAIPVVPASISLTPGEEPTSAGELPDWLSAAIGEAPAPAQTPPPAESKPTKKAFSTGALDEMGISPTSEIPDWMAGLTSAAATGAAVAASQPEQPSAKPAEPATEGSSLFGDMGSLGELPDWLSGAGDSGEILPGEETPLETATKAAAGLESRAEEPKAAPTLKSPAPAQEPSPDSLFSMDVPEWLLGFTPTEAEMAPVAEEAGLGQAELPAWVQAMRPMETVISSAEGEDDDQTVEKEGPLAGFRSVLPALPGALEMRKPKIYSIKLQVDANQQAQAALLERLIASEASSQPITTPKPVAIIRPLRWVIAAVLLLAVLLPALLGSQAFPLPFAPTSETADFYQTLNGLPEAAPVLVVFDYQPGYAGEMESAAAPVIDHLMSKNARLAFVSSSPSGVLMGERMMAKMHTQHPNYAADEQYVDLGYLPGGAAGIQVFANNPQKTLGANVLHHDTLTNLWILPPLAGTQVLSDFAAVIVLTDNPDTGRLWVEQAGPALGNQPMLMVISAQAEPMIRPYYKSGQLRGMVTGLEGGAAYEQVNARPAQARLYWDSYGMGMIATELLIVIGGAWALLTGLRERRESQEEGEE